MRLSDLKAGSNTKQTLLLPVASHYPIEMTVICGSCPGKTLVVTAGVHGCEYVGIETLNRLKKELDPIDLSGRIILLPLVNPEGFYMGSKQIIPADGQNLNRTFPGDPEGTFSSRLAKLLEETLYPEADFLIDLHGGDVNEALTPLVFFPTTVSDALAAKASAAAASLSIPYRVASTAKLGCSVRYPGTFSRTGRKRAMVRR
jgi:predicted deacylase